MARKSFGAEISEDIAEQFIQLCDQRGYTKYRAMEGALRAFMAMPAEEQVRLMTAAENTKQADSPTVHYKLLTKQDSDIIRQLREALGPEVTKTRRKKKIGG